MEKYLFVLLTLVLSCCTIETNSSKKEKPSIPEGKYYYVDSGFIIHTKRCCITGLSTTGDSEESEYKGILFIEKRKIRRDHFRYYCAWCVDESAYEQIEKDCNKPNPMN